MTETLSPSVEELNLQRLLEALETHAEGSLARLSGNGPYVESVRRNIPEVERIIRERSGSLSGVISSWKEEVEPVGEALFNRSLADDRLEDFREFTVTAFPGIYSRIHIISIDEIFGPTLSLDLASEDQLPDS